MAHQFLPLYATRSTMQALQNSGRHKVFAIGNPVAAKSESASITSMDLSPAGHPDPVRDHRLVPESSRPKSHGSFLKCRPSRRGTGLRRRGRRDLPHLLDPSASCASYGHRSVNSRPRKQSRASLTSVESGEFDFATSILLYPTRMGNSGLMYHEHHSKRKGGQNHGRLREAQAVGDAGGFPQGDLIRWGRQ